MPILEMCFRPKHHLGMQFLRFKNLCLSILQFVPDTQSRAAMQIKTKPLSQIIQQLCRLRHDDQGAILSTELILVSMVAVIGMISGLASVRDSMVSELSDIAGSVQNLNQSYSYNGVKYIRNADGTVEIQFDVPPTHESEEGDVVVDPIVHVVGGNGSIDFSGGVTNGTGGSVSGVIGDGTTDTTYTTTTDTGRINGTSGGNLIAFAETPGDPGTFTTTFADPIADLELYIGNLMGDPNENIVGNFTVTLSDGTVLNNAAFSILPDAITPGGTYGAFNSGFTDQELLTSVNIGGLDYVKDPTNNGSGSQGVGRLVFTDVPPPGDDCIGISSISFDREGGPFGFRAFFSYSGNVIDIQ